MKIPRRKLQGRFIPIIEPQRGTGNRRYLFDLCRRAVLNFGFNLPGFKRIFNELNQGEKRTEKIMKQYQNF